MENLKKQLLASLLFIGAASVGWADQMVSRNLDLVITKDLLGATGSPYLTSAGGLYSIASAWGEPISGHSISSSSEQILSGYYSGRFGNWQTFTLLSSQVGLPNAQAFYQDQLQVGVAFNAPVEITFTDQVAENTIAAGIQVLVAIDHLGHSFNTPFKVTRETDRANHKITLHPQEAWLGNTLYDVQVTPDLLSIDSFPLDQTYHIYFVTMLDPREENIVLNPLISGVSAKAAAISSQGALSIHIPNESLSDYSAVLISHNPLNAPLHADPKIIQEANDKARAAGSLYRVPISIQEINAYNPQGELMGALSKPAQVTLDYGTGASLVRPETLSLWVLDEAHRLWVKIPASQNPAGGHAVTAPVTRFSVFALIGSSEASAMDSYVFPVPWRPHGPKAGTSPGQTGTEADGIHFSNLPPECTIRIYTLTGELVREIHHADLGNTQGQEKWDVKTTHGEVVASGVYLWRTESSVDGKNGKLMVIR